MPRHAEAVSKRVADQFRRLDRRLHIDRSGRSEWVWAIPVLGFVLWVATLVVVGVMKGVWAAEYIPTAIIEGLVVGGLFVACIVPEAAPPENDQGDRGPETEPPSSPLQFDPTVWLAVLADLDTVPADEDAKDEVLREPVGASLAQFR